MQQQSCQLPRLSPELIFMIVGYNDPSDILALSLTCSDLHHRCRSLLVKHQDAYNKYRITSDLSPETAVDLLKDTPAAEINRYHVRELELWGSRLRWEDWRSWDPALSDNYQLAEEEPSRSVLNEQEVQRYIQKGVRWWDRTEEEIEDAQLNLEYGNDGYLKLLLISSCPRLHSIRFVKRRGDVYNSLAWIAEATQWSLRGKWPPGFESLRSMTVGISIGQLPNEEEGGGGGEEYYHRLDQFVKLFDIPRLKNIYFSELCCEEDLWEEDEGFFPHRTSSVENIFLDGIDGDWDEFYQGLCGASRKLDTVVIRATDSRRGGLNDLSSLVDSLAETEGMERFVLYHPAASQNQPFKQTETLDSGSLRQITTAVPDVDFRSIYDSYIRHTDIRLTFPPNIEAVYIWGEPRKHVERERVPLKSLDSFLADLIESEFYENLKVIYVEHVERTHRQLFKDTFFNGGTDTPEWKKLVFPKTTAAGLKTGVHVCTLMNRDDGGYWKNFPARPDRFDIKTGPFAAERPEEWKLNLYTGQWEPDCNGCGECEECLALYPAELWKENAVWCSSSD